MEKTITIDGKDIRFKSTAAAPLRYKAQFGRDFFGDILKMAPLANISKKDTDNLPLESLKHIDFDVFYNILWTMAKTADKSIPEPMEWLDGFDEFPLMEIFPQVQDLLLKNLGTKKK
ncbi:hypothetical protein [Ornithinibacillus xuwenensis]|jgi:hypothetical protein|uniref:Prophage pi2 protein 40 n=1 Tax=Ornithinibacillus xuwenensis TaxID=3144668 RepID=A0ABU9XBQ1_9BACI